MKDTLEVINRMQTDGVIARYAIGGAVGATLYLEPSATLDVDVFVEFPAGSITGLVSLSPIYEYMRRLRCKVEGEHIIIGKWPVQFLVPGTAVEEEAVAEAVSTEVEGIPTRVMTAEHLVAIALQTGRAKDHARILQFLERKVVDLQKLQSVLSRHGLKSKWSNFSTRYLDE
jgi:hypothetical protein